MRKNIPAQIGAQGSVRTTSGYVRNTKPGPEVTTDSIDTSCSRARLPKIANVIHPARILVRVFTTHVIIASLKFKKNKAYILWAFLNNVFKD